MAPPAAVWKKIEHRIEPANATHPMVSLWYSLSFWRGLGITMTMLVLVLGLILVGLRQETSELQRVMVVLNDQSQTGWVVTSQVQRGILRVSAIQPTALPAGKVCQLWLVTQDGNMLPLGVLPHRGSMEVSVPGTLEHDGRFLVSIEAASLAPVERPSGEIVFEGRLTRL
jgi:anti-sigma-K factor RskA